MPSACSRAPVADARELQQLRRADRAGGQDDLAARPRNAPLAALRLKTTPVGAPAFDDDALGQRRRSPAAGWAGPSTGFRKPRAALQRRPRFWFTWK